MFLCRPCKSGRVGVVTSSQGQAPAAATEQPVPTAKELQPAEAPEEVPIPADAPEELSVQSLAEDPTAQDAPVENSSDEAPHQNHSSSHAKSEMENIKATTEQLRAEANIQRKKVSEVSKELMEFCEKNKATDMLVSGPIDAHNPFQEKKSCLLL